MMAAVAHSLDDEPQVTLDEQALSEARAILRDLDAVEMADESTNVIELHSANAFAAWKPPQSLRDWKRAAEAAWHGASWKDAAEAYHRAERGKQGVRR
jgi:hypothetical protein